jgi:4-diphosphocytidyl-2-C-methyl-D-erythritol kinase
MKTPAKVNFYLEVLGKRADSYHNIKTVFLPVKALYDDIKIEKVSFKGIQIECGDPLIPKGEDNICWRAAAKFANAARIEPSWKISIKKRIPVAAGLGGGSSDGAAVLKILDKLIPGKVEIEKLAPSLGADVAYFLNPVPAFAEGIGEKIKVLKLKRKIPVVIVNPLFPVSSAWAYSHLKKTRNSNTVENMIQALEEGDIAKIAKSMRNDLAPALYDKFPLLEILRNSLMDSGALNVEISGSGSSLFGISETIEIADKITKKLSRKYPTELKIFSMLVG